MWVYFNIVGGMIESGVGDMFYDKLVYVLWYGDYYVREYDEFY